MAFGTSVRHFLRTHQMVAACGVWVVAATALAALKWRVEKFVSSGRGGDVIVTDSAGFRLIVDRIIGFVADRAIPIGKWLMAVGVHQTGHSGVVGLMATHTIQRGEIPIEVCCAKTCAVLVMAFKTEARRWHGQKRFAFPSVGLVTFQTGPLAW